MGDLLIYIIIGVIIGGFIGLMFSSGGSGRMRMRTHERSRAVGSATNRKKKIIFIIIIMVVVAACVVLLMNVGIMNFLPRRYRFRF